MTINKPYTFIPGTLGVAPHVNANFDILYTAYNRVVIRGVGIPENVVSAGIGTIYQDIDPLGSGRIFRKTTSVGTAGWTEIGSSFIPVEETIYDLVAELTTNFDYVSTTSCIFSQNGNPIISNNHVQLDGTVDQGLQLDNCDTTQDTWRFHFDFYPNMSSGRETILSNSWDYNNSVVVFWNDSTLAGSPSGNPPYRISFAVGDDASLAFPISGWLPVAGLKDDYVDGQKYRIDIVFDKNRVTNNYALYVDGVLDSGYTSQAKIAQSGLPFKIGYGAYSSFGTCGYGNVAFQSGGVIPSTIVPSDPNTSSPTESISGGGSATILNVDSTNKEFYVTATGDKLFNSTNLLGDSFIKNVWSNSGNLNTARYDLAGCGTQNSGLSFGGTNGSTLATTEKFNGSIWTNTSNLNTAGYFLGGCGTQNAGLSIGGSYVLTTQKFNGTTWSLTGNIITSRYSVTGCGTQNSALCFGSDYVSEKFNGATWSLTGNIIQYRTMLAGCGTQNNALNFGGVTSPVWNTTEKFNSNTWISANNLNTSRDRLAGSGTQNAGLSFGGYDYSPYNNTEKFDGMYWTNSSSLNSTRRDLAGCGTQNNALAFGGISGATLNTSEKFVGESKFNFYVSFKNGTVLKELNSKEFKNIKMPCPCYISVDLLPVSDGLSEDEQNDLSVLGYLDDVSGGVWTTSGNLNSVRRYSSGCGLQNSSLSFGGEGSVVTERFNGTTWANTGNLGTARDGLGACGTQTAGLGFGGYSNTYTTITEKFNGATWTTSGNLNTASEHIRGAGTQNSGLRVAGLTSSSQTPTNKTEKFNGSVWTNSSNLNTARIWSESFGTQNSGVCFGGYSYLTTTEKFNGNVWSYSSDTLVTHGSPAGCGTQNMGLAFGGYNGTYLSTTEKFNGNVWSLSGDLNLAREHLCGSGTQSSGLSFSGSTLGTGFNATTEKFNTSVALPLLSQIVSEISYI